MVRYVKIVLISVFIYWISMWLSAILLMMHDGGIDSVLPVVDIIIDFVVLTVILSPVVFFIWLIVIKKMAAKKYLVLFLWNLTMWVVITAICEKSFSVISGHIHGLSDFRRGWCIFLLMSTVFTTISYLYANKRLKRIHF